MSVASTVSEIREALVKHLDGFIGQKNTPDTLDAIKARLREFFSTKSIDIDEHFDIVPVGKDDFDIRPKTDWAREFLSQKEVQDEARRTHEQSISELRAKMDGALKVAIGTYLGKKNTPFTRFQIAQRLRPLLANALDLSDKEIGKHFDIAVTPKGIDVIPKTEWAKALLPTR